MSKNIFLLCFTFTALLVSSCKKETKNTDDGTEKGTVRGTVYALRAGKTISGARVYVDAGGKHYQAQSNTSGAFSLELPVGHHQLYIETGKGKIFQTVTTVDIAANQTLDLPAANSKLLQRGAIAYIPGTYDAIEQIITDSLGYTITLINQGQLYSLLAMQTYQAIFINCGAIALDDTAQYNNLAQYVTDGGSLYVSDWAASYLTGHHTGGCTRPFGFIDDTYLCSTRSGSVVTHNANIVDTAFQTFMGKTTMSIYYDLPQWEVIQSYDPTYWDLIVQLPNSIAFMLRKSNFTDGSATGTTSGNIYFTTFHNHPNGLLNQDMQHMLEYVILNL